MKYDQIGRFLSCTTILFPLVHHNSTLHIIIMNESFKASSNFGTLSSGIFWKLKRKHIRRLNAIINNCHMAQTLFSWPRWQNMGRFFSEMHCLIWFKKFRCKRFKFGDRTTKYLHNVTTYLSGKEKYLWFLLEWGWN